MSTLSWSIVALVVLVLIIVIAYNLWQGGRWARRCGVVPAFGARRLSSAVGVSRSRGTSLAAAGRRAGCRVFQTLALAAMTQASRGGAPAHEPCLTTAVARRLRARTNRDVPRSRPLVASQTRPPRSCTTVRGRAERGGPSQADGAGQRGVRGC